MIYVYVLKCIDEKWYIGKTTNPYFRIADHKNGDGSGWTKRYPPISVEEIIEKCDDFDEDKYTKKYMASHFKNKITSCCLT